MCIRDSIGIVVHGELHAVADSGVDCSLDLLVEIEIGLATRCERKGGIVGPVSYTHLDVYKRQDHDHTVCSARTVKSS